MMQSFVGRGDAIDGDVFKWIFPIGPTYWGQMANNIQFIKNQAKGNLKGGGPKAPAPAVKAPVVAAPVVVAKESKHGLRVRTIRHSDCNHRMGISGSG